jgi:hypothetical protein
MGFIVMRLRTTFSVLATIGLLNVVPGGISAATNAIVDEGFIPSGTQGVLGRQGVRLMERPDYVETASVLRAKEGTGGWKSCSSLGDANCASAPTIEFGALLQPCSTLNDLNCIVEFGVVSADGSKIPATVDRKFPAEAWNKYPADDNAGLPVGGPGALWKVPDSAGLPVALHFVRASVVGTRETTTGKFTFSGFSASLTPVSMTTMPCQQNQEWNGYQPNPCTSGDYETSRGRPGYSGFVEGSGWSEGLDCEMSGNANYANSTAECALRKPASLDTNYFLNVRLAQSPQGWLHGRLSESSISINEIANSNGAVTISLQGKPVRVPVIYKEMPFGDLPTQLQDKYRSNGAWPQAAGVIGGASNWGLADGDSTDPTKRNRLSIPPSYGPSGIEELEAWMSPLGDTATADRATWSIRTLRTWEKSQANSCIADKTKVTGIVLTNATQYLAGAPTYNTSTNSLDYKVAAPHYMSDGNLFKGRYELLIRSDVARCIYKFTDGPITASIEVVDSANKDSAATTRISESDGWFRMQAIGFTHSTPTIRSTFKGTVNVPTTVKVSTAKLRIKSPIRITSVVKKAGFTVTSKSKVTVKVNAKSVRKCRIQGSFLKGIAKGSCSVTVSMTKGKKITRKTLTYIVS